jgi:hypothetical protein
VRASDPIGALTLKRPASSKKPIRIYSSKGSEAKKYEKSYAYFRIYSLE